LQKQQIENQIETIIMKGKTISTAAADETMLTHTVDFPDQMNTAVFGAVPYKNNTNEFFFLRNNNSQKSICVLFNDHQQIIKHTSLYFSGESVETFAELPPGSYEIVLKLVQQHGETYVQIFKAG
jgi:coproporphyrinogen III oxidase